MEKKKGKGLLENNDINDDDSSESPNSSLSPSKLLLSNRRRS